MVSGHEELLTIWRKTHDSGPIAQEALPQGFRSPVFKIVPACASKTFRDFFELDAVVSLTDDFLDWNFLPATTKDHYPVLRPLNYIVVVTLFIE